MTGLPRILALTAFAAASVAPLASAPLTNVRELRHLTLEEVESDVPVDLRGIVIFAEPQGTVFFQDEEAGTFFQLRGRQPPSPGDEIRVRGRSYPGLYVPGVEEAEFEVLGRPGLPDAVRVSFDDLASGRYHYQRVAFEGIVRTVEADDEGSSLVRATLGSRVVEIRMEVLPQEGISLVDGRVRVSGLAAGEINNRRQLVEPYLRCRDWSEIELLEPPRPDGAIPEISPEQLLNFAAGGQESRRVKLSGTVIGSFADGEVFLRSGETGVGVSRLANDPPLGSGDEVELIGFPEMDRFSARLVDAVVREHLPGGTSPEPIAVALARVLDGSHDGDLVTFDAELSEQYRTERGAVLVLREGSRTIRANAPALPDGLAPGATVRVSGIAVVESTRRSSQYRSEPDQVSLRLRSSEDLAVLRAPSWWTSQRLAAALVVLLVATVFAGLWITLLQRQVARQTAALRHRIRVEAALEERQRIAREFHDTLEQELAGLALRLDAAAAKGMDDKLRQFIEGSRKLVSRIQTETRNLVSDLRQEPGEEADLIESLGELVDRQTNGAGPEVTMVSPVGGVPALPSHIVHHLRMVAQESVTNAIKHAGANHVAISVVREAEAIVLRVADDGRGFDATLKTSGKSPGSGHFGCMGMRERCRKIGAEIEWRSELGRGTEVVVALPLEGEEAKA